MTFDQLECFIAAVEQNTFFDAAESVNMTQSALSKQIMKLERDLDLPLFDRSGRSAVLTEGGQLFYKEAIALFAQYRQSMLRVQQYREQTRQQLRIGTLPILSQYGLTPLFGEFARQHPQIIMTLDEVEETELMHGLDTGGYDLIIARSSMFSPEKYHIFSLAEDRLAAILPCSHPLAKKESLSLRDLAEEHFILMKPYTSIHQLCMKLFEKSDTRPNILRTARMESIIGAISAGEGVSLLPEKSFQIFSHEDLTAIPIQPAPPLSVVAARKKAAPASTGTARFWNYMMIQTGVPKS
ncbi:MAG: LysR family transcriptional regulator [Clostridiales bacterium]|nr:LysR family transcriptional regulator [Clostridiales bacterium]